MEVCKPKMVLAMSLLSDNFFTPDNAWNILRQISVNLCLSIGMTLVVLTAGIDLSVGAILAMSGLFGTMAMEHGYPIIVGVLIGILTGLTCGLLNGTLITLDQTSFEVAVVQSFGNCPQYIHTRHISQARSAPPEQLGPSEVEAFDVLDDAARELIRHSATFFVASF